MKNYRIISLCAVLSLSLSACTYIHGKDAIVHNYNMDYRYAESLPVLKMPSGVQTAQVQSSYPAPESKPAYGGKMPSLVAPNNPGAAE